MLSPSPTYRLGRVKFSTDEVLELYVLRMPPHATHNTRWSTPTSRLDGYPPQFRGSCQCVGSLVSYNRSTVSNRFAEDDIATNVRLLRPHLRNRGTPTPPLSPTQSRSTRDGPIQTRQLRRVNVRFVRVNVRFVWGALVSCCFACGCVLELAVCRVRFARVSCPRLRFGECLTPPPPWFPRQPR